MMDTTNKLLLNLISLNLAIVITTAPCRGLENLGLRIHRPDRYAKLISAQNTVALMTNVKDILAPVPQPYKKWIARVVFLPPLVLLVLVVYPVESFLEAIRDMAHDIPEFWQEADHW